MVVERSEELRQVRMFEQRPAARQSGVEHGTLSWL